jgi:hypothetical protein
MRTLTVTFGWRDYSQKYHIKCEVCDKTMTRTVSSGCNDMADAEYRRDLIGKLRAEAEHRQATETETCAACLKKKMVRPEPVTFKIPSHLCDNVNGLYNAYRAAVETLAKPYIGKVVRFKGAEWVLSSIDDWNGLTCYLQRINKVRPWQTTDAREHCKPHELDVTAEIFEDREKAVEAA